MLQNLVNVLSFNIFAFSLLVLLKLYNLSLSVVHVSLEKCHLPTQHLGEYFRFLLNWRLIASQYCVVSATHQHESALRTQVPPPS